MYGYENIVIFNQKMTIAEFKAKYPDCQIKGCQHFKSEIVEESNGSTYRHRLEGMLQTSMGMLNVFNYPLNNE